MTEWPANRSESRAAICRSTLCTTRRDGGDVNVAMITTFAHDETDEGNLNRNAGWSLWSEHETEVTTTMTNERSHQVTPCTMQMYVFVRIRTTRGRLVRRWLRISW
jgi:hypothetical protein